MTKENDTYNVVAVSGKLVGPFVKNHEVWGKSFYETNLEVVRASGHSDILPVMVSERLLMNANVGEGMYVTISGAFRSYNKVTATGTKLLLYVSANTIEVCERTDADINSIELYGFVCKKPIYRKTPRGREITELLLAVNRASGKTDYIPCICWGCNAQFAEYFRVGDEVKLNGRVQSREYKKALADGTKETRIAYEMSVQKVELVTEAAPCLF